MKIRCQTWWREFNLTELSLRPIWYSDRVPWRWYGVLAARFQHPWPCLTLRYSDVLWEWVLLDWSWRYLEFLTVWMEYPGSRPGLFLDSCWILVGFYLAEPCFQALHIEFSSLPPTLDVTYSFSRYRHNPSPTLFNLFVVCFTRYFTPGTQPPAGFWPLSTDHRKPNYTLNARGKKRATVTIDRW